MSTNLSHLDRERHSQAIRGHVGWIRSEDLRLLRAWLLDVVEHEKTAHLDMATLRGEIVHAQVEKLRRERLRTRLKEFGVLTDRRYLAFLATFPDLAPPAALAEEKG